MVRYDNEYKAVENKIEPIGYSHLPLVQSYFTSGHQELCDYCPSEFQDEEGDGIDEVDDGFKRHHHHRHKHRLVHGIPVSGYRRHEKIKKPTVKVGGEYEMDQSKEHKSPEAHHLHHNQRDTNDKWDTTNEPVESTSQLLKEENADTYNTESANYGEYKYDQMTVEDTG